MWTIVSEYPTDRNNEEAVRPPRFYKYCQVGLTITCVTVPVHDIAFCPGLNTGKTPLMRSFIRVVP